MLVCAGCGVCLGLSECECAATYGHNDINKHDEAWKGSNISKQPLKSDGGPSSYYDFLPGWKTWNDFAEWKAIHQWGAYSLHFKDVGKLMCRFGAKDGTSEEYDLNKGVYSFLRMKEMKRRGSAREYLLRLLDDPQFQE